MIVVGILAILGLITRKGWWPYLWREWITSVDHKRIGVMYVLLALVHAAARLQRRHHDAHATGAGRGRRPGYLPPEHYDQIFSAHGTIMIFFMAMPFMIGLMNFVVPLQLGVRDVAFPVLNSVSFWLTAAGALLVNLSLFVGEFARTGWLAYPPLSELAYSPGVGVDYYLWSLQISRHRHAARRHQYGHHHSEDARARDDLHAHADVLLDRARLQHADRCGVSDSDGDLRHAAARPLCRHALLHERPRRQSHDVHQPHLDMGPSGGLHPDSAGFGVFSEVIATFSGKPLFGYRSMVLATMAICVLSFLVWLHHFFTMGAGADVNAFFGIMTMIIAVPTGVKMFNWLFTMYGGRVRFKVPVSGPSASW